MQIEPIILTTYIISLSILFVFASHGYSMVYYYFKTFNKRTEDLSEEELQMTEYPLVTIQLPLYNEKYVICRLIDAVIRIEYPDGATPLDPDEIAGLLLTHITTRGELNRWEQDNITDAISWLDKSKPMDILNESFIRELHKRMFCNVWRWAGKFRTSQKNIGIKWWQISTEVKILCDDAKYWIEHQVYSADEIAIRFHHKLVSIHPFPNGNGRHARLMTDPLLENILQTPQFTWASKDLSNAGEIRGRYIGALYEADRFNFQPLIDFARS